MNEHDSRNIAAKRQLKPFPYSPMAEKPDALDLLNLRFRWGGYAFHVLRCHLTTFPPGKTIRFHKHSEYEFHFIPRGKGTVILGKETYALQEGLFYLTGPGVLHQQEADPFEPMDELCLHIEVSPLDESMLAGVESWERQEAEACMRALDRLPLRPLSDTGNAMAWFLTAYRAWQDNQPGYLTSIKHAIIQILLRSARGGGQERAEEVELPTRDMTAYRFRLASRYIRDNYASPMTLQDVADRLHISGRQLQRVFRDYGSGSFRSYLENYRLSQVCAALEEGRGPIEQIAAEHGFQNGNYLYYVFRKKFGMTPTEYKRRAAQRRMAADPERRE